MADAADRVLKILLQMGVVGQEQVQAALTQLQAQATEVAATVKKVSAGEWLGAGGQKITDTNVPNLTPQLAQAQAYQSELAAIANQERTYAAQYAAEWTAANEAKAASQTASVAKTEEEIAAEARLAAQKVATNLAAERRVIIETQIEAAEARIAGNTGQAAQLEREADIWTRSLSIQRALNVSTEESIALAEKLVQAEEATAVAGATMGINIAKARQEATVLGRELATGTVRASTLGSLLGSLGPTITIASIAAYELYKWITSTYEEEVKVQEEAGKLLDNFIEAQKELQRMARNAKDVGDQIKLSDSIKIELSKASVDAAKWRSEELVWWKSWADDIAGFIRKIIPDAGAGFGANAAKLKAGIIEPTGDGKTPDSFEKELADQKAAAEARYAQLVDTSVRNQLKGVDSVKTWLDNLNHLPRSISDYNQKLDEARAKVDRLAAALKAGGGTADSRQGLLGQYRDALRDVKDVQSGLDVLVKEQDKLNKKTKEGSEARKEFSASLREDQNTLQRIRIEQELINKDPFLDPNAKQNLLAANARQELASLNVDIQRQQSLIHGTALDPVQLQQAIQKLQEMQGSAAKLNQTLASTGSVSKELRTSLAQWAQSFGDTGHQIGEVIKGSVNAALQQMNQWILTGKFSLRDLLSSFAQLGLQLLEQLALQKVMSLLNITTTTAAAQTAGPIVAAAWATPAALVSVATEGEADAVGQTALAETVAFSQALSIAHEGGVVGSLPSYRGGPLASDERLVVTRVGEIIIPTNVRAGIPRMHNGGVVGGGSSSSSRPGGIHPKDLKIEVFHFTDLNQMHKKWVESTAGHKVLSNFGLKKRWGGLG
jgi:hypothetical protein